tara:strand:+ start:50 stop:559 length:510 start_codon:yes stop_codon:yes gene_type:complete
MTQTKVATNFLGAGAVGQIVSVTKTDSFSTTSTSLADITGFTASITPQSTSSKILILSSFSWGSNASPYPKFSLLRGSTEINVGDAQGSSSRVSTGNGTDPAADEGTLCNEQIHHHYLDSPSSASAVTYKWQTFTFNSGRQIYIGRTQYDTNSNGLAIPTNITLIELLQ